MTELVNFIGGPLDGLTIRIPSLRGSYLVVGYPKFFGIALTGKHRYKILSKNLVTYLEKVR